MDDRQDKTLDYAPAPKREGRDVPSYYREPPAIAKWTVGDALTGLITFLVLLAVSFSVVVYLVSDS